MPHYLAALSSPALLDHASLTGRGVAEQPTGRAMHLARAFALSLNQLGSADPVDIAARALLARGLPGAGRAIRPGMAGGRAAGGGGRRRGRADA